MQNPLFFNNHQYLNRLALTSDDMDAVDPYAIIKDFFHFGNIGEIKNLFMEACRAALSEKYNWKQGSPGNLLYFYERLEMLVEVCFLLSNHKKHKNKLPGKLKHASFRKILDHPRLPCSLSVDEIRDPFSVIQAFFEFHTIKKWKQDLYAWMEAGLSNYTVLDSIEAKEILSYHNYLLQLLDACWYISLGLKKKKKKRPGFPAADT